MDTYSGLSIYQFVLSLYPMAEFAKLPASQEAVARYGVQAAASRGILMRWSLAHNRTRATSFEDPVNPQGPGASSQL